MQNKKAKGIQYYIIISYIDECKYWTYLLTYKSNIIKYLYTVCYFFKLCTETTKLLL